MFKKIYSKNEEIYDDVRKIILKEKEYSLKELLQKFAIPGTKIEWKNQKKTFKVIARNDNFIIIARPFNLRKTFEYSILDLQYMQCNRDNMIFGPKYNYSNIEECNIALKELKETRDNDICDGLSLSERGIAKIENVITGISIKVDIR